MFFCSIDVGCPWSRWAFTSCVFFLFTNTHFAALPYAYILCNGSENSLSQILFTLCVSCKLKRRAIEKDNMNLVSFLLSSPLKSPFSFFLLFFFFFFSPCDSYKIQTAVSKHHLSCYQTHKVLHLGWSWVKNGLRGALRRTTLRCWCIKNSAWATQKAKHILGCIKRSMTIRSGGLSPSTLLSLRPSWSTEFSYRAPRIKSTWTHWSESRGEPQSLSGAWSTYLMKRGWDSWDCSPWKRDEAGKSHSSPLVTKGEGSLIRECGGRTRAMALK